MSNLKGKTLVFDINYPEDITDWKIRAEFFDNSGNSVKLATTNTGGSDDQIEKILIGASLSTFRIKIPSGATTNFDDIASLEFEYDTGEDIGGTDELDGERIDGINLVTAQIDWTTPNE